VGDNVYARGLCALFEEDLPAQTMQPYRGLLLF
jgi:hypothetical protein